MEGGRATRHVLAVIVIWLSHARECRLSTFAPVLVPAAIYSNTHWNLHIMEVATLRVCSTKLHVLHLLRSVTYT